MTYKGRGTVNRIREVFLKESKYKVLLISILITSLAHGLYKGMLDAA